MKKNRNAFFSENNMNFQGYNPLVANAPYQASSSNNMFYSGQMPMMPNMPNNYLDEYSERLAKLERQVNRLEHRLNSLEANGTKTTDDFESTTNNMYII